MSESINGNVTDSIHTEQKYNYSVRGEEWRIKFITEHKDALNKINMLNQSNQMLSLEELISYRKDNADVDKMLFGDDDERKYQTYKYMVNYGIPKLINRLGRPEISASPASPAWSRC